MKSDRIFLEGLRLKGRHGVSEDERRGLQEFQVDIIATYDARRAVESGVLADTADYARFLEAAAEAVEGPSFALLEQVASRIAEKILEDAHVEEASVTIRKLHIFASGVPGVTIVRTKRP